MIFNIIRHEPGGWPDIICKVTDSSVSVRAYGKYKDYQGNYNNKNLYYEYDHGPGSKPYLWNNYEPIYSGYTSWIINNKADFISCTANNDYTEHTYSYYQLAENASCEYQSNLAPTSFETLPYFILRSPYLAIGYGGQICDKELSIDNPQDVKFIKKLIRFD